MTDPQPASASEPGPPPGMPRWVKIAAVVVGLLVLLFLVLQLTGIAGEHGPGMHSSLEVPSSGRAVHLA
jgi:cytochrome b561